MDFAVFHIVEDFVSFVDQQLTSDTSPKIFLDCVHINIAFNIIRNEILIVIADKGDLLNFIFLKKNSFNLFELVEIPEDNKSTLAPGNKIPIIFGYGDSGNLSILALFR